MKIPLATNMFLATWLQADLKIPTISTDLPPEFLALNLLTKVQSPGFRYPSFSNLGTTWSLPLVEMYKIMSLYLFSGLLTSGF